MNTLDIIKNIDKSEKNTSYVNVEDVMNDISNVYHGWPENENIRLKAYHFAKWYCTDSWVGGRIYFLDDEAVAISWQTGRKSSEDFDWISKESIKKTKEYLSTLYTNEDEDTGSVISKEDLEKELGAGFNVSYGGQLLTKEVIHKNGEIVKVVDTWNSYEDIKKWKEIEIEFQNGEQKGEKEIVQLSDVLVPFDLKSK